MPPSAKHLTTVHIHVHTAMLLTELEVFMCVCMSPDQLIRESFHSECASSVQSLNTVCHLSEEMCVWFACQ